MIDTISLLFELSEPQSVSCTYTHMWFIENIFCVCKWKIILGSCMIQGRRLQKMTLDW